MYLEDWIAQQQTLVDSDVISFDYSVRPEENLDDAIVIAGGFNPFSEEDDESPIIIEFIVSKDIDEFQDEYAEFDTLKAELQIVINHELIHFEQFQAGKFQFDDMDQLVNRDELEEEAYRLEQTRGFML